MVAGRHSADRRTEIARRGCETQTLATVVADLVLLFSPVRTQLFSRGTLRRRQRSGWRPTRSAERVPIGKRIPVQRQRCCAVHAQDLAVSIIGTAHVVQLPSEFFAVYPSLQLLGTPLLPVATCFERGFFRRAVLAHRTGGSAYGRVESGSGRDTDRRRLDVGRFLVIPVLLAEEAPEPHGTQDGGGALHRVDGSRSAAAASKVRKFVFVGVSSDTTQRRLPGRCASREIDASQG